MIKIKKLDTGKKNRKTDQARFLITGPMVEKAFDIGCIFNDSAKKAGLKKVADKQIFQAVFDYAMKSLYEPVLAIEIEHDGNLLVLDLSEFESLDALSDYADSLTDSDNDIEKTVVKAVEEEQMAIEIDEPFDDETDETDEERKEREFIESYERELLDSK